MSEIEAAEAQPAARAGEITVSIRVPAIFVILLCGLVFRLALATMPGFSTDMGTFQSWAQRLANSGPWDFYQKGFFSDYAPGYLYMLWFLGLVDKALHFSPGQWHYILKLPAIAADLASVYLLYRLLEDQKSYYRVGAALIYALFPAALLLGPVWGQIDSLLSFFLLLTIYFFHKNRPVAAGAAYIVGFLVKPQAVAAFPFFLFWLLRNYRLEKVVSVAAVSFAVGLLMTIPFFPDRPWALVNQILDAADVPSYRVSSFWAFNFWGTIGFFKSDIDFEFLGIAYRYWGMALFALWTAIIIVAFWGSRGTGALALGVALSQLAFYVFLTRMHERYMFPVLLPLLAACVLLKGRILWAVFALLSVIHFFNLYYIYSYYPLYNPNPPVFRFLYDWIGNRDINFTLSLLTTMALPLLIVIAALLLNRKGEPETA